jgi:DHA3 family macrolide efflux protein-like MFS transporter
MIHALKNRSILFLWSGQALSSIGDEIYRVAFVWIAVSLIGANSGYLAAGQAAALLLLSLIGGKWADHWDPLPTMIWVDGLRALIVLIPVVVSIFMPIKISLLWVTALSISALSAFFDPALQASLPRFSPDLKTLRSATGLMSTTIRLARVAGPSVVGFLSLIIPTIQFFTIDSLSFAVSAFSISRLLKERKKLPALKKPLKRMTFYEVLTSGYYAVRRHKGMTYVMFAKAVTAGTWNLSYGLGFALLVQAIAPGNIRAFGLVIASYGIGNFIGALILGNIQRRKPFLMMYSGFTLLGICFALMAVAPGIKSIMFLACVGAVGGPMNDLPFIDIIQTVYPIEEMTKVFRFRITVETTATLLCMVSAPFILKFISISTLIGLCGLAWIFVGLTGLIFFLNTKIQMNPS